MNKWGSEVVTGDTKPDKPKLIGFKGIDKGCKLLKKHVDNKSKIVIHADVDVDGIGATKVLHSYLRGLGVLDILMVINKEKIHGIQEKHADYLNNNGFDENCLLIIVDSSTNEVETIRKFNCDVLVVDHHNIDHNDIDGKNDNGKSEYVIINNMIGNQDVYDINRWIKENNVNSTENIEVYDADSRMSCGLVIYELLRVYSEAYNTGNILENLMLYQWVAVTLFSDVILLANDRNQWYIENTVHTMEVEASLKTMLNKTDTFRGKLDKSFILFKLAPIINKAIRAGESQRALDIVINRPQDIGELQVYGQYQKEVLEKAVMQGEVYGKSYIAKDITDMGISRNYCGVIASMLLSENYKNTVVFIVKDGVAEGSFRGLGSGVDYRRYFEEYAPGVYAEGHASAFGFKVKLELLDEIMDGASKKTKEKEKFYLTAGYIDNQYKGEYHIDDIDEFKKSGDFWRISIANSKLSNQEQLSIMTGIENVKMVEQTGAVYRYNVLGFNCKAFEVINTPIVEIYAEYTSDINIYVRNYTITEGDLR